MYVVDRDFGFAPNPFHGSCTLATCKPKIRKAATIGDWVVGMGGSRLSATGRCIFAMRVSSKLSFDQYWSAQAYKDKIPVRNGSMRMMIGDNIYHRVSGPLNWAQADSHHSNADGSVNAYNLANDTSVDAILVSDYFYYFGSGAPAVPRRVLDRIGYRNGRSHRVFDLAGSASRLVIWLECRFADSRNQVLADPFDFNRSVARYSVKTNRVV